MPNITVRYNINILVHPDSEYTAAGEQQPQWHQFCTSFASVQQARSQPHFLWIRNWSHIAILIFFFMLGRVFFFLFKKAQSSVVSNRIWVKFSRNVLNANTRRMTETFSSIWRHNFKMEEMTSLYASIVLWGWSEKEGVIGYKMWSLSLGQGAIAPPKNTGARVSFRSSIILARHCWLIHKRLQKACTKMHRFACKISKLLQVEHPTRPSKLERMPSLDRSSSPLHRLPLLQINSDLRHRIQVTESTHCTLL